MTTFKNKIIIIGLVIIFASLECFLVGVCYKNANKELSDLMLKIGIILISIGTAMTFMVPAMMYLINKYCYKKVDKYDLLINESDHINSGQYDLLINDISGEPNDLLNDISTNDSGHDLLILSDDEILTDLLISDIL